MRWSTVRQFLPVANLIGLIVIAFWIDGVKDYHMREIAKMRIEILRKLDLLVEQTKGD